MRVESQVIISEEPEAVVLALKASARESDDFIHIHKDGSFLVDDANLAIEKAYLASENRVIIILSAKIFSEVVQNRLLKIIEEPPKNKEFILIMPSKSMVLPTIRSRLPIRNFKSQEAKDEDELSIDVANLDSRAIFEFVKENRYEASLELSKKLQKIFLKAIESGNFEIDESLLQVYSDSIKALEKGSVSDFVAATALLKLLSKRKRKSL